MSKCTYDETGCGDCELTIKADKYRWHDLRKSPTYLPIDENYVVAKIRFYGKGSEIYRKNCYTSGIYDQHRQRWNFEQDHKWHDEYNPIVNYEVLAWKYIEPFEEVEE